MHIDNLFLLLAKNCPRGLHGGLLSARILTSLNVWGWEITSSLLLSSIQTITMDWVGVHKHNTEITPPYSKAHEHDKRVKDESKEITDTNKNTGIWTDERVCVQHSCTVRHPLRMTSLKFLIETSRSLLTRCWVPLLSTSFSRILFEFDTYMMLYMFCCLSVRQGKSNCK